MRYDHMFVQDTQPARGIPASRPVYSRQGTYWGPEVEPYVSGDFQQSSGTENNFEGCSVP